MLITILLVTFLAGQGFKVLAEEHALAWSPAGNALGRAFTGAGVTPETAEALYLAMWWIHIVTVLFFLDYLPYSKHGSKAYCCDAGGGRIWMEDVPGITERPAENRVREAARLLNVGTIVVCCPKDFAMFQDALKTGGLERKLVVRDLIELVEEAAGGGQALS